MPIFMGILNTSAVRVVALLLLLPLTVQTQERFITLRPTSTEQSGFFG
jgi:hypothetical protein